MANRFQTAAFGSPSGLVPSCGTRVCDFPPRSSCSNAGFPGEDQSLQEQNLELQNQLAQRAAMLRHTISELEEFSYCITHDLRAPLRAMQSFAQLLAAECSDLGSPARDLTRRISASAERMDRLLQDALNYSRVLQADLSTEPVDIHSLLRGIIDSYPEFQEPNAHVWMEGHLPIVEGNVAALSLCFANLLRNAVKFVAAGVQPSVRIHATAVNEREVRIWFEDNGIGIEKDHHQRIFGMFQRLDRTAEGTGIGLAIVRKAVERMDASVGLESTPGQGSRFWLQLKKAEKKATYDDETGASCRRRRE